MEDETQADKTEEKIPAYTTPASYTTTYGRERTFPPTSYEYAVGVDWKTAVFIVGLLIFVEAFTLGIVLLTWEVIGNG